MMESRTETRTAAVQRQSEEVLMPNYRRAAVAFARGEGVRLYDLEGRAYLDFVGGIAVSSLGHAHPRLVRAIQEQAARLLHVSNLYLIPEQTELAQWLTSRSRLDRAFFCNSGAEANEAAIKLARRFHYTAGPGATRSSSRSTPSTAARWPRSRRPRWPNTRKASARCPRAFGWSPLTIPARSSLR